MLHANVLKANIFPKFTEFSAYLYRKPKAESRKPKADSRKPTADS